MFLTTCEKLHFPAPAVQVLQDALAVLEQEALEQAGQLFLNGEDPKPLLQALSERHGIPLATVTMVCLVLSVPKLQALYEEKGVDTAIMWDTLIDLTCKLREHFQVNGVWGSAAISWYQRVFTLRILKLGRLEYEPLGYKWDTAYGDVAQGCPVLNIHIPSCGSLPIEAVLDSLKQAYAFFGGKDGQALPFVCASWMLYPPMCEAVFPKGSNLDSFYRCFEIVEQYADPDNKNFWRIFGMQYAPGVLETAPVDTSLRRRLLDWMVQGSDMGIGRGAFLFDGDKIQHIIAK